MKVKIWLAFAACFMFLVVSPAFAITPATKAEVAQALAEQKRELIAERKQKMTATKCANVEGKIQTKTERFNEGKVRRLNAYNNLKARLTSLETKLAARGYDTTKLKADLPVLQTKIDKFSADYAVYIAALAGTKNYACGKAEGEFRAELLESKGLLTTVHADSKAIKDYYASTIKIDLQAIKKQTSTIKSTGSTAESTNTNDQNGR